MKRTWIVRVYTRLYTDSGQKTLYVDWSDGSRTACDAELAVTSMHMRALVDSAVREGLEIEAEIW